MGSPIRVPTTPQNGGTKRRKTTECGRQVCSPELGTSNKPTEWGSSQRNQKRGGRGRTATPTHRTQTQKGEKRDKEPTKRHPKGVQRYARTTHNRHQPQRKDTRKNLHPPSHPAEPSPVFSPRKQSLLPHPAPQRWPEVGAHLSSSSSTGRPCLCRARQGNKRNHPYRYTRPGPLETQWSTDSLVTTW